jgi:hypothetical protein
MKATIATLLGDACGFCRVSTSGFHAIQITKVQANRATYLEKWASMSGI